MPVKSICRCGGVRINGKCDHCEPAKKKTAARGYGSKWQSYSKKFRRNWPFCVDCKRKKKLTSIHPDDGNKNGAVDHIIRPPSPDHALFWDPTNHIGRCTSCHSKKTILEESGNYDPFQDKQERLTQLGMKQ